MTDKQKNRLFNAILYIALAAFTTLVGHLSLGPNIDYDVMAGLGGSDSTLGLMIIKSIQENGLMGIYFNPRIGTPDTSTLLDFPVTDPMAGIIYYLIILTGANEARVIYTYYVIMFPLVAVPMAILLRKLGVRREICFVAAAIFAFAPYHFTRGIGHISLANYMYLPITVYLALYIVGVFENEAKWKLIISSVLIGLSFGYYYAFGLIMLAFALVMRCIHDRSLRVGLRYVWIPIVTLFTVGCSLAPQIIYGFLYGKNTVVGVRLPVEQETYGLKIIQMLLPPVYSRVPKLSEIANHYFQTAPLVNENYTSCLGFVTSFGFIGLCVSLVYSFCAKDRCKGKNWLAVEYLALATLALVLMGAIGGFGEIFNMLVTPQIRAYNRCSIYIAGMSVIFVALFLNHFKFSKLPKPSKYPQLPAQCFSCVLCAAILAVSIFDTVPDCIRNTQGAAEIETMYQSYFDEMEDTLGDDAMVYQLPFIEFPETGPSDYKQFLGYIFTDTAKWSYGGVKGRNTAAAELNVDEGMSLDFLRGIKEAGFDAVYIDKSCFPDEASASSALEFYSSLGIEPMVSGDEKIYVYDIRNLDTSEHQLN